MENVYYVTVKNNQAQNSVHSIVIIMREQLHVETNQSKIYQEKKLSLFFAISQRVCVAFVTNLQKAVQLFQDNNTRGQGVELGSSAPHCPALRGPPSLPSWSSPLPVMSMEDF